jgi:hypothetical protein
LTTVTPCCAGGTTAAAINCAIAAGDSITAFSANGLDSGNVYGGAPANISGAAFGGVNRNVGTGTFEMPEGRSTYNALQMSYQQQMQGFTSMNLTVAYTLSRFVNEAGGGLADQNFSAPALDFNNPSSVTGPSPLDRTDAFKFGLTMEVAHHGPRLSVIGNFGTAHPSTPFLLAANGGSAGGSH